VRARLRVKAKAKSKNKPPLTLTLSPQRVARGFIETRARSEGKVKAE